MATTLSIRFSIRVRILCYLSDLKDPLILRNLHLFFCSIHHFSPVLPDKEGWLWKQGSSRYRNWKRRWFILNDNCLYYFEYTTDKEPRGLLDLTCFGRPVSWCRLSMEFLMYRRARYALLLYALRVG
jgi:hypothetical protein